MREEALTTTALHTYPLKQFLHFGGCVQVSFTQPSRIGNDNYNFASAG